MKTMFIAAALALTTLTASANKEKSATSYVSSNLKFAFEKEFGKMVHVTWSTTASNMYRASFTSGNENVSAFFDKDGSFIASTVQMPIENIPVRLQAAIQQKEKDGVVIEALEFSGQDDHAYFLRVLANGKEKLYKAYDTGGIFRVNF